MCAIYATFLYILKTYLAITVQSVSFQETEQYLTQQSLKDFSNLMWKTNLPKIQTRVKYLKKNRQAALAKHHV